MELHKLFTGEASPHDIYTAILGAFPTATLEQVGELVLSVSGIKWMTKDMVIMPSVAFDTKVNDASFKYSIDAVRYELASEIIPKNITVDDETGVHIASFSYYEGIRYAKFMELKQTTSFDDVKNSTHFMVAVGDVMVRVKPEAYKNIERQHI